MLSASNSRTSIKCPDLHFSTSLEGNGAVAGDNIRPPLAEDGVVGKSWETGAGGEAFS